ncbi:MAG: sulfite exporter TauE/SafE family protein [Candidatus Methylomirabilia bacterium]
MPGPDSAVPLPSPAGQALGTALTIEFVTGLSCTTTLLQGYRTAFRPIHPLAWAGTAGSIFSSLVLPATTPARFPYLLAILLIGSAGYALLNRVGAASSSAQEAETRRSRAWPSAAVSGAWRSKAIISALFAGGVSRSLGVGAGLVFVPFLTGESGASVPVALAAAQAADLPVTLSSSLWFLHHGQVNFPLAAHVGAGSTVGAQLGVNVLTEWSPFAWRLAYLLSCLTLWGFLLALT